MGVDTPNKVDGGIRLGRCPKDGHDRGWGLQFTQLPTLIRNEASYQRAMALAQGRTIVDEPRLMNLYLLIRYFLPRLERGHLVEFGSYRGGSALFMASLAKEYLPGISVYALDTFEGMPSTDKGIDGHHPGDFADTSYAEVVSAVLQAGLDNLLLVKGLFADTIDRVMQAAGRVALAHLDCDIQSALVTAWDGVKPHMVKGGYVAFDDATTSSCMGATEMVEQIVIQRDGLLSEQIFPHYVFRLQPI